MTFRHGLLAALLLSLCSCASEGPAGPGIRSAGLAAETRFLSLDLFEGRGVATKGEQLTTEYLAAQLALAGAEPAGDAGGYFQRVPLVEVKAQPDTELVVAGRTLRPLDEYVGSNELQTGREVLDAEIVFVGHGITAPEFDWDDYKGTDVTGKVLVLFTNEPPSEDDAFFGGRALTYYGRWTFKYEEAARREPPECSLCTLTRPPDTRGGS